MEAAAATASSSVQAPTEEEASTRLLAVEGDNETRQSPGIQSIPRAWLLRCVVLPVSTALLLLALVAFGSLGAWPRTRGGKPGLLLAEANASDGQFCERCPTGECDRNGEAHCQWWKGSGGGYHCRISDCSLVPKGRAISSCWHWQGHPHYSINDETFPCRRDSPQLKPVGHRGASPRANTSTSSSRHRNASTGTAAPLQKPKPKPSAKAKLNAAGDEDNSLGAPIRPAADRNEARKLLTAYWDAGHCGPVEDDHNTKWCGGHTLRPDCAEEVDVEASLCESGKAFLEEVKYSHLEHYCFFWYFAQYSCRPTTTTTTTTTITSTTSTTATSTTKTTSTSTTVTTTTTTTPTLKEMEAILKSDSEAFEARLLADGGDKWSESAGFPEGCASRFTLPEAPQWGTDLNGLQVPDVCFQSKGPHRVFVIGDWGGIVNNDGVPEAARQRKGPDIFEEIDRTAQLRVADQMRARAALGDGPDYVLNVGDCFYWAGLNVHCGSPANVVQPSAQLEKGFENVYTGAGLDGKPWLGVLGNHDYGGYMFTNGWDQLIAYSWGASGRWVMPAQYWRTTVHYPGFSVDYFFADSNRWDAYLPEIDMDHNICSREHNKGNETCGQQGPVSLEDCPGWFLRLWEAQEQWLRDGLAASTSAWQIVVTHIPPVYGQPFWAEVAEEHGIDLFVTGHMHYQAIHYMEDDNPFRPTAWLVSGGGGGVTSVDPPTKDGTDDQYGFFELSITKDLIEMQCWSHGGHLRSTTFLRPRQPKGAMTKGGKPQTRVADRRHLGIAESQNSTGDAKPVVFKKL